MNTLQEAVVFVGGNAYLVSRRGSNQSIRPATDRDLDRIAERNNSR